MTAETLTGANASRTLPVYKPAGGYALAVAHGSYSVAAAVEDGDIFELFILPAGAVVVAGEMWVSDMDTGTEELEIDLGYAANGVDAASVSAFVNSGVLSGDVDTDLLYPAGTNLRKFNMTSGPVTLAAETVVQAEVIAPSSTSNWQAGTIYAMALYYVP